MSRMQVGRSIHQRPEAHAAAYAARQARRSAEAVTKAEKEKAEAIEARLNAEDETEKQKVEKITNLYSEGRREDDRARLRAAVLHARRDWILAGREGGFFDVHGATKTAKHALFGGVPPAPKVSSPTAPLLNLPPPRNAEEAKAQYELRAKAYEQARRDQQALPDAYARLGFQNPASCSHPGTGRIY